MKITVNGQSVTTKSSDLAALLVEQGFPAKVATARNGAFVPAALRATTVLAQGDLIEVLSPMQGG